MVKVEIENELGILLQVDTIRKRAYEVGRIARRKSYVNRSNRGRRLKFDKEILEMPVNSWKLFDPTSENSIFSTRMVKLWSGEHHVKNSIQKV